MTGIILLIDFEKAFDSVEWGFLDKVLDYFGFGNSLRKWINLFYTDIESFILNNGHSSRRFKIDRGVRQGDPLSPYLFLLCVEILSIAILTDPDIKGWTFNDSEYIITQYADDTTLLLDGSEHSFEKTINTLELFSEFSGLKLNCEKTKVIWFGTNRMQRFMLDKDFDWKVGGKFTMLGITFDLSQNNWTNCNYQNKMIEFKKILNSWTLRDLTLLGKITVIKSLALPKLVMLFNVLPNPPENMMIELERTCFNFIWGGKPDKIKRTTVINSVENGGLNMIHIKSFCEAQKISWIKKLLDSNNTSDWKRLLESQMEKFGGNYMWYASGSALDRIKEHLNQFWCQVLDSWAVYKKEGDINIDNVLQQPIFLNGNIKINSRPFFYKDWFLAGIHQINDLIDNQGHTLTHEQFCAKFNIEVNFLRYEAVTAAIPKTWRELIRNLGNNLADPTPWYIRQMKLHKKPSKMVYLRLRGVIATKNRKSEQKWTERLEIDADGSFWTDTYCWPNKCTRETKLRNFQYKLTTRILPTNKFLFKCKMKETQLYTFCNLYTETLEHLFHECKKTFSLLLQLKDWLNANNVEIDIDPTSVILGNTQNQYDHNILVNHILLITKYFIYRCKLREHDPSIELLKQYIKLYYKLESSCEEPRYSIKIAEKWNPLINELT